MTRQKMSMSIWIASCIISLFSASICFAQYASDISSEGRPIDCADLVDAGDNAEAFSCFGRAIEDDPEKALNWAGQGDVMNNIGYYFQALVYYEMAIELDPYSANILTSKGRTLSRLGKYADAMTCFNLALSLDDGNSYTWKSIGDLYTLKHDTSKAEAAYSRARMGESGQSDSPPIDSYGDSEIAQSIRSKAPFEGANII